MVCELCGEDSLVITFLPIRNSSGAYNTASCLQCVEETGAYCPIHQIPHVGFEDETHACYRCINDETTKFFSAATLYTEMLRNNLPPSKFNALYNWAESVSDITRMIPPQFHILRAIIALARRKGVRRVNIMRQVLRSQSIEILLPFEEVDA